MTVRRQVRAPAIARTCGNCGATGYGPEARYCQMCGAALPALARENTQQPPSGLR